MEGQVLLIGDCGAPRTAWQIDPFGHSREQANLFAKMGMESLFLSRIDYRDKEQRARNRELQMIWEAEDSGEESSSIFTGAFAEHYTAPIGFCFDYVRCYDEPLTPKNSFSRVKWDLQDFQVYLINFVC